MLETNLQCGEAFLGPPWQVNVNRGAHAGAQVGGAEMEVAVLLGDLEVFARLVLNRLLHRIDSPGKSLKDALHISALLHGDDPQLVLLIDLTTYFGQYRNVWQIVLHWHWREIKWKISIEI